MKMIAALVIYGVMFVVTFGKVYNEMPDTYTAYGHTFSSTATSKSADAWVVSMAWPMYWSVKAWEK